MDIAVNIYLQQILRSGYLLFFTLFFRGLNKIHPIIVSRFKCLDPAHRHLIDSDKSRNRSNVPPDNKRRKS